MEKHKVNIKQLQKTRLDLQHIYLSNPKITASFRDGYDWLLDFRNESGELIDSFNLPNINQKELNWELKQAEKQLKKAEEKKQLCLDLLECLLEEENEN